MKQDNAYNHRIDRGWEKMHSILETEMPLRKKNNRQLFLWILFGGIFLILLLTQFNFLFPNNGLNEENLPVEQHQNMAEKTSDKLLQQESIIKDNSIIQKNVGNKSIEQSQVNNTSSIPASTYTKENEIAENAKNLSTTSKESLMALTSTKQDLKETSGQQKKIVTVLDNELKSNTSETITSDESYVPAGNVTVTDDVQKARGLTNISEADIKQRKARSLQLSIERVPTLSSSLFFTRENNTKSISFAPTLPVKIKKEKARLFTGISVAGIYSSQLSLKGWNAGLHLGLTKNKIAVSVYGKLGFLKRNGVNERSIVTGFETMEDDLSMGIDFDTMIQSDKVVEKFRVLETGLSLEYRIKPHTFVNLSSGIDYYFNSQAQDSKLDLGPAANGTIFSVNQISGPSTIEHSVVPFISLGVGYEFIKNLQLEASYKRQLKKPLRNLSNTSYVHQYNMGLKYFF